jgi:hypothetical protein
VSGTIWLIAEAYSDAEIVKAILKRRYPQVRVKATWPTGSKPNVSRLASQIEELISQAIKDKKSGDCIAVLHDADLQTRPDGRQDYDKIKQICKKYKNEVMLVIAHDEIESWLLADEGFCSWLETAPGNWDNRAKPSEMLNNLLDKAKKPRFREPNLNRILIHIDGTGDEFSPSMKQALQHLEGAVCVRSSS